MPDAGQYALYRVIPRYLRRLIPGPQLIAKSTDAEDPYIMVFTPPLLGNLRLGCMSALQQILSREILMMMVGTLHDRNSYAVFHLVFKFRS